MIWSVWKTCIMSKTAVNYRSVSFSDASCILLFGWPVNILTFTLGLRQYRRKKMTSAEACKIKRQISGRAFAELSSSWRRHGGRFLAKWRRGALPGDE